MLQDAEWRDRGDNWIAKTTRVNRHLVESVKQSLGLDRVITWSSPSDNGTVKYVDRWGNEGTMRTGNIGRKVAPVAGCETIATELLSAIALPYPERVGSTDHIQFYRRREKLRPRACGLDGETLPSGEGFVATPRVWARQADERKAEREADDAERVAT